MKNKISISLESKHHNSSVDMKLKEDLNIDDTMEEIVLFLKALGYADMTIHEGLHAAYSNMDEHIIHLQTYLKCNEDDPRINYTDGFYSIGGTTNDESESDLE